MEAYNIFIVEDMGVTRATIASVLSRNGHKVIGSAASAEKAWIELEKNSLKPDLILLDLNLKGNKTGIWLANKIKSKLHIPFIFITAYGSKEVLNKLTALEPNGYIMKPFNNATLLGNIQLAISNFEKYKTIPTEPTNKFCLIKNSDGIHKIFIDEIVYLQSEGNYVKVFLQNNELTFRYKLDDLLKELNSDKILKTHRRYAINLTYITKMNKEKAFVEENEIPISKTFLTNIEATLYDN